MKARLIINADDFGYDPAVSRGVAEALQKGALSSTTLMVNTPHSLDAAARAGSFSVGLHLNLARHAPLWPGFPVELLEAGELVEPKASTLPPEVVRLETLAQLDRLQELLRRPATHLDVHRHLHRHPNVLEGLCAAAKERALPVRSINEAMRATLRAQGLRTNDHFLGDAAGEPYWTPHRLRQSLEALPVNGVIELMCHPGYAPTHVNSSYAAQREVELSTFCSPEARELLEAVELVDFQATA